jgi:hypothetical protein
VAPFPGVPLQAVLGGERRVDENSIAQAVRAEKLARAVESSDPPEWAQAGLLPGQERLTCGMQQLKGVADLQGHHQEAIWRQQFRFKRHRRRGQILVYSTVRGKVTSSGKCLAPTMLADGSAGFDVNFGGLTRTTHEVLEDDGTYGSSSGHLYWWDTKGVYGQHYVSGGTRTSDKHPGRGVSPGKGERLGKLPKRSEFRGSRIGSVRKTHLFVEIVEPVGDCYSSGLNSRPRAARRASRLALSCSAVFLSNPLKVSMACSLSLIFPSFRQAIPRT